MLNGIKPDLSVEKTWGSRVYVVYAPEKQLAKLLPRAWPGQHIGNESEVVYLVYDSDKDVVK